MGKIRTFVSSVQKELELERVAVAWWVSADPLLAEICDVVLFEKEPLRLLNQKGKGRSTRV